MRFLCQASVLLSVRNPSLHSSFLQLSMLIIKACGDRSFTDERRTSVIRKTSKEWPIEFVEAEFRPSYPPRPIPRRRLRKRGRRHERTDSYGDEIPLHAVWARSFFMTMCADGVWWHVLGR